MRYSKPKIFQTHAILAIQSQDSMDPNKQDGGFSDQIKICTFLAYEADE